MLYLANGDLRDFEKSREIKISLRESSLTNLAKSREKNRIGAMAYIVVLVIVSVSLFWFSKAYLSPKVVFIIISTVL